METVREQEFRSMIEQMANDYYNSTWVQMNHTYNYMDRLIWVYDKIVEENPHHFRADTLGNNSNTCKFLRCLTATIIQQIEWNPEQEFKSTVMKAFFRPITELPPYYEDVVIVDNDEDDDYVDEEPSYDNNYIDHRIDDLRNGHWTSSTLLEMLEYIVGIAVMRDKNIMLKNNPRHDSYNRLHYRNYQADSIFPKWIESLVEQVVSGGRKKSSLSDSYVLARAGESNIFPEFDEDMKLQLMYSLAVSVVCELSNKLSTDRIAVRLSMLRPGLFSLENKDTVIDVLNMDEMTGIDRLFTTYKIFGYFLYHTPHSEQILELMVEDCQLDKKEGWSIG